MNNKLTFFLSEKSSEVNELAKRFSNYRGKSDEKIGLENSYKNLVSWFENFDKIQFYNYELLLEVLKNIEFIEASRVQDKLIEIAKEFITKSSNISPLGEISESSFRLTSATFNHYINFRVSLPLLLDNMDVKIDNKILLFDDFLNSGGQIVTIFYKLLGIKLLPNDINDEWEFRSSLNDSQKSKLLESEIHVFFYKAFDEGIKNIETRLKKELKLNIKIHCFLISNKNSGIFGDYEDQTHIKSAAEGYIKTDCLFMNRKYAEFTDLYLKLSSVGEQLLKINKPNWDETKYKERSLGYNNYSKLIVTDSNIPTISLTALWLGGNVKVNGAEVLWYPLFERREKKLNQEASIEEENRQVTENDVHEFIQHYYLKRNLTYDLDKIEELKIYHSNYFKSILNIAELETCLEGVSESNIFDYLCDFILQSEHHTPLLINGVAGCGKSTFLSILYTTFYKKYKQKEISVFPVYINLHKYNKEPYVVGELFQFQAINKINSDLLVLENFANHQKDLELVVIIDGNDEHSELLKLIWKIIYIKKLRI